MAVAPVYHDEDSGQPGAAFLPIRMQAAASRSIPASATDHSAEGSAGGAATATILTVNIGQ